MTYHFSRKISVPFDEAVARTIEALKREGFGILTDIDVSATLKSKLGEDFRAYRILGACNPQLAFNALTLEDKIGTMLPCNVIVRKDDAGKTVVEFMDPNAVLQLVGRPEIGTIAAEVRARLERVMAAL